MGEGERERERERETVSHEPSERDLMETEASLFKLIDHMTLRA